MKKFFAVLILGSFYFSVEAQDGPFSFYGKTTIFNGNQLHWDATQDATTNLIWSSWSDRYFKINGATFRQSGDVGIGIVTPLAKLHIADGNGGEQLRFSRGTGSVRFAQDLNQDNLYLFNSNSSQTFMFWKADGKVGIGTSGPTSDLHIANLTGGGIRIGKVGDGGNMAVPLDAVSAQYNIDFTGYRDIAPDQIGARIAAYRINRYTNNYAGYQSTGLLFSTNPSGGNSGTVDLVERMRITPEGFVGIGSTNPTTNVHIGNSGGGGLRIGAVNDIGNYAVGVGEQTIQYNLDFSGYRDMSPDQIGARIAALRFNGYQTNAAYRQTTGLAFYTNPSGQNGGTTDLQERVRILPDGNVGIGTSSPDAKLAVKGTIHSQEVKVDLNGAVAPDYVFEPDYKLLSLEEIKSYIEKNKHLPEVPSAKEMETNGVNVSEMNMLLLKKIEELTLYVIELKKRDDLQQKEIEILKSKIK